MHLDSSSNPHPKPQKERPSFSQEEAMELQEWARKKGRARNERLSDIKRARTIGRISKGVALAILAMGLGIAAENKDNISAWWARGFNDNPRGPSPGIILKGSGDQHQLQCLADLFSDEASLLPNIGGNKWVQDTCKDVTSRLSLNPRYKDDPLVVIANEKNAILRAYGLQSDDHNDHAVVEWWEGPLGMRVQARVERLEEIQAAQIAQTGTTNFEIE